MFCFSDVALKEPATYTEDDADCKKLWEKSVILTKLKPEEMAKEVRG